MGIRTETLILIEQAVEELGGYEGLRMCELGNQQMRGRRSLKTAKRFFAAKGVWHVSLDRNEEDGAIAVDLNYPLDLDLGEFDLVTNYGTSEHIAEQYQVFKTIHDLTRMRGFMVHCIPMAGDWNDHGLVGYEDGFIYGLATANGYEVYTDTLIERDMKVDRKRILVSAVLQKRSLLFMTREEFKEMGGISEYPRLHSEQVRANATA